LKEFEIQSNEKYVYDKKNWNLTIGLGEEDFLRLGWLPWQQGE